MATSLYLKGSESGAKAEDEEWFAADIDVGLKSEKAIDLILQIAVSVTPAVVEVTLDGGTTWSQINSGVALAVDKLYQFDIFAKTNDTVNFRASNTSGTTLDVCYIIGDLDA